MPTKASKNVYRNNSKIISGVIAVLATAREPLSLQELVDEMKKRHLVIFHGSTPRNTVSGEISKLLNAVGPNNAPILKVNQGKLTKFFLRPSLQQEQDGLKQVSNGKVQKNPSPRITRHSYRSSPSISSASSFSSSSSSDEQTTTTTPTNRIPGQKKRRTMEDLKAAYLLSCLSAHSFWLNYKNEPEKDFEYFVAAHLGTQGPMDQTDISDGDVFENASSDASSSVIEKECYAAY